jgi:two-component system, LuxR family, response regulator FixJ
MGSSPVETVFIVDDDLALGASMSRSLRLRGWNVEVFSSAGEFLSAFDDTKRGCLLLDYGMPGMNGLELQSRLIELGHQIPVIFITGHAGIPESVQATKAGAVDFLEKPYQPDVLAQRIEDALVLDRAQRKAREARRQSDMTFDSLTVREKEICMIICQSPERSSSKAIARDLNISPRTVDLHRSRILEKLDCRSVVELIGRYGSRTLV